MDQNLINLDLLIDSALTNFRKIFGAHLGNVQLLDMASTHAVLNITAQHGFKKPFLDAFAKVSAAHDTACGRALRLGKTVIVVDVETDAEFAPFRQIARDAGYRGVISTPVVSRWGHNVGIISAHFANPCDIDDERVREGEDLARQLAHDILRGAAPSTTSRMTKSAMPSPASSRS